MQMHFGKGKGQVVDGNITCDYLLPTLHAWGYVIGHGVYIYICKKNFSYR